MPDPPRTSLSGHLPMEDLVHTGWSLTQVDFVYLLFRQEQCPYPTDPYPIPFLLLGVVAQSHLVHTQTQSTWPELLKFYLILSAKRMSELRKDISKWLGWQVASATSLILKRALAIVALGAGLLEPFPESPKWQSSLLPSARASPGWPATPLVHFLGVGWDLTLLNSFHSTSLTVSLHIFFPAFQLRSVSPCRLPLKISVEAEPSVILMSLCFWNQNNMFNTNICHQQGSSLELFQERARPWSSWQWICTCIVQ